MSDISNTQPSGESQNEAANKRESANNWNSQESYTSSI